MYIDKLFPFFRDGDFVSNKEIIVDSDSKDIVYIPYTFNDTDEAERNILDKYEFNNNLIFNAVRILPYNLILIDERYDKVHDVSVLLKYLHSLKLNVIEIDYYMIANQIEISNEENGLFAHIKKSNGIEREEIATDYFINLYDSMNQVTKEELAELGVSLLPDIKESISLIDFVNQGNKLENSPIKEASQLDNIDFSATTLDGFTTEDSVYSWLDAYLSTPEGEEFIYTGNASKPREVVPLLIGPTAVFKSATVKELCKKYDLRLVDFRVSFTSRLDYSGLFEVGMSGYDEEMLSYSCPMEELVTCSDGFRAYCVKAHEKVKEILDKGTISKNKVSDGNEVIEKTYPITDEQRKKLEELLEQYEYYMKTPVLFFDEITRSDSSVEGVLVTLLNQKRYNDMTMNGCKFIAATNLNISKTSVNQEYEYELNNIYDVNMDLDVAYANRFLPLNVYPEDVMDRWFEWAESETTKHGKDVSSIHPDIIKYLKDNKDYVYNNSPVIKAISEERSREEIKSQTFPNYRTWEMVSDYLYSVDAAYDEELLNGNANATKVIRPNIIFGLISEEYGSELCQYLYTLGYVDVSNTANPPIDDVADFLSSTLDSGTPALIIGPSSLGKSSKVKQYAKKIKKRTGLDPVVINVNLSTMDATDLMGMPVKQDLTEYVSKGILDNSDLGDVTEELQKIIREVQNSGQYGMVDKLTLRAPNKSIKDSFQKALEENREVILFFDECNRCENPTVMSAMFQCISDKSFAGVSFKNQADKVKIVAACNMAHADMFDDDEMGNYANAGSIDPALAARFSVYWKKKFDENDVKSWIEFMEEEHKEGNIDISLLNFFKDIAENDMPEAIRIFSLVEKRTLETSQPSTRMFYQLSRDIKSMRGDKNSLFAGKIIFDDSTTQHYQRISLNNKQSIQSSFIDYLTKLDIAKEYTDFYLSDIKPYKDSWEAVIKDDSVDITTGSNKVKLSAVDILDTLEDVVNRVIDIDNQYRNNSAINMDKSTEEELDKYIDYMPKLISYIIEMDSKYSSKRRNIFESYIGSDLAQDFTNYFNSYFGSGLDEDITLPMIVDPQYMSKFFKKYGLTLDSMLGDNEGIIERTKELVNDFYDVFNGNSKVDTVEFLRNIKKILEEKGSTQDTYVRFLTTLSGDKVDSVFKMAEDSSEDKSWIIDLLSVVDYVDMNDIKNMEEIISNGTKNSANKSKHRTSSIL